MLFCFEIIAGWLDLEMAEQLSLIKIMAENESLFYKEISDEQKKENKEGIAILNESNLHQWLFQFSKCVTHRAVKYLAVTKLLIVKPVLA